MCQASCTTIGVGDRMPNKREYFTCEKCRLVLPSNSNRQKQCKMCRAQTQAAKSKAYRLKNPLKYKNAVRNAMAKRPEYYRKQQESSSLVRRQKEKEAVMSHYSKGKNSCVCCGQVGIEFLTIDHINNDGAKQRRELKTARGGASFYRWLRRNGYPGGYQVLCANCNLSKEIGGGVCAHKRCENGNKL